MSTSHRIATNEITSPWTRKKKLASHEHWLPWIKMISRYINFKILNRWKYFHYHVLLYINIYIWISHTTRCKHTTYATVALLYHCLFEKDSIQLKNTIERVSKIPVPRERKCISRGETGGSRLAWGELESYWLPQWYSLTVLLYWYNQS